MKTCLRLAFAALLVCLCAPAFGSIQGDPYLSDDVGNTLDELLMGDVSELVAERTSPTENGIHVEWSGMGPNVWDDGALSILAEITYDGTFLHYSYTLTSDRLDRLSHFTFEISEGAFDDILNPSMSFNGEEVEDPQIENGDGSIGSLADFFADIFKFDESASTGTTTATFEFDTLRLPVFGNFVAKDGTEDAMNSGLAQLGGLVNDVDLDDPVSWIPVPDTRLVPQNGGDVIPEPLSLIVWGGLVGLAVSRRARV